MYFSISYQYICDSYLIQMFVFFRSCYTDDIYNEKLLIPDNYGHPVNMARTVFSEMVFECCKTGCREMLVRRAWREEKRRLSR